MELLDRIDNTKGYIVGNVQWVALGINYMKLSKTDEDVHKLLRLVLEYYK